MPKLSSPEHQPGQNLGAVIIVSAKINFLVREYVQQDRLTLEQASRQFLWQQSCLLFRTLTGIDQHRLLNVLIRTKVIFEGTTILSS